MPGISSRVARPRIISFGCTLAVRQTLAIQPRSTSCRPPPGRVRGVGAAPAQPYHEDEGPEYRIGDIERTVGHAPGTVGDPVSGFLRQCGGKHNEKRCPARKGPPGYNAGGEQDDHTAMHVHERIGWNALAAEKPIIVAIYFDDLLHHRAMAPCLLLGNMVATNMRERESKSR